MGDPNDFPDKFDTTVPATPDRSSSDYPMPEGWDSGGGETFYVTRAMDGNQLNAIGIDRKNSHPVE